MQLINIQDDICWKCGKPFDDKDDDLKKTVHHMLPQTCNPVKNVTVPIHEKCHREITSVDMIALTNYAFKLKKNQEQLNNNVEALTSLLTTQFLIKIKK